MRNADAVSDLDHDLRTIFGQRFRSLVVHGARDARDTPIASLALVDSLSAADLRACGAFVAGWQRRGLATPLLLAADEFARSLDAFPFEFGAILADHQVISGDDPFTGLSVEAMDLRRACEVQARSHLLHLREAYIETQVRPNDVAALIARSAPPLAALLRNVGHLSPSPAVAAELVRVCELDPGGTLSAAEAERLFPGYLRGVEQLVLELDRWSVV